MAVRLFWNNFIFDALSSSSLVPSSQAPNLPATNVQNQFRSRVWRSGRSNLTETLTIDFGIPITIDAFIAFFSTINENSEANTSGVTSGDWGENLL